MRYLAYIFYVIATIGIITGCSDQREQYARVLDIAAQQNVNYDSITHIDSIEAAVKYFDRQGTSNERMRAHYLLGCAYRDAGEAPKALECYQQAADCGESNDTDCDYHQMIRVYSQMEYLFDQEMLPYDMLDALKQQHKYALLANDTLAAINAIELSAGAYALLNKPDSMVKIRKKAYQLYLEHGYRKEAALAIGAIIEELVKQEDLKEAKRCIDIYERESGVVKDGEIIGRKATYYYFKGRYYLSAGKPDSAEILFRRLLLPERTSSQKEVGYRGLYLYYKQTNQKDSLAKYADLSYQTSEENFAKAATDEMRRMQSVYNYGRSQRLAQQMEKKAHRNEVIAILILAVAIVLGSFSYQYYRRKRQEHHQEIQNWQEKGQKLEAALNVQKKKVTNEELMATPSYKRIKEVLTIPNEEMSRKDWEQLRKMIDEKIPSFYSTVIGHRGRMDILDYHVCILVRLYFTNGEIAFLTGNQPNTISMKRKRLLQKVFGIEGPPELFDKKVQEIC
jgi:hypothetical protein